jgi:hypothetical protein
MRDTAFSGVNFSSPVAVMFKTRNCSTTYGYESQLLRYVEFGGNLVCGGLMPQCSMTRDMDPILPSFSCGRLRSPKVIMGDL